ncbi:MAG: hypothetical protein Ct9H300mP1_30220 [Planctomycetaceae bacterium]|nr:MAG: hypothetical protein Ct9H300mP1_30220 [Planctomycetaceae bacterium]
MALCPTGQLADHATLPIATEVLEFVAGPKTKGVELELDSLRPEKLSDLQDDVFLQHDPNVYNFIIDMNRQLNEQGLELEPVDELQFDCITDGEFPIEEMPGGWFNFIDLESAIEIYTPMYQLLLTDSDFWRACNSLQLDETISIYAAQLIGEHKFLGLVNNRHPIVPRVGPWRGSSIDVARPRGRIATRSPGRNEATKRCGQ